MYALRTIQIFLSPVTVCLIAIAFQTTLCPTGCQGQPAQVDDSPGSSRASPDDLSIQFVREDGAVKVNVVTTAGALPFTVYDFRSFNKPVLYPVFGPHQLPMTRNYPMQELDGEQPDHPHQKSIWVGHEFNHVDFWTGKGGRIEVQSVELAGPRSELTATSHWVRSSDDSIVLSDRTTYRFGADENSRWIDAVITFTASHGPLRFEDSKEGVFAVRVHPKLRSSAAPKHGVTDVTGVITNSAGQSGDECWGQRAAWVDYSGEIESRSVGISMFDHPDNFRHPTTWHARNYGLLAANPFGLHSFLGEEEGAGAHQLDAGQSLTFRYRILLHSGDAAAAEVSQKYTDWSGKPTDSDGAPAPNDGWLFDTFGGQG